MAHGKSLSGPSSPTANVDDPSSMDMSHPITKDTLKGALDASDPSYQFFSLLGGAPPE